MRLDEILRRQSDIAWHEGVSVVQAICRGLTDAANGDARFPLAEEVSISAEGVVSFIRRPSGFPGVLAAGRLLGEMLQADVPAKLGQIHTDAVASPPAFASIEEFSAALAYFERPDAQALIGQLCLRSAAQAGVARETPLNLATIVDFLPEGGSRGSRDAPATPTAAPGEADADEHTAALRARLQGAPAYEPARRRRNAWTAVALGAVVIVSGALLAYGRDRLMPVGLETDAASGATTSAPESTTTTSARPGARSAAVKTGSAGQRVLPPPHTGDGRTVAPAENR